MWLFDENIIVDIEITQFKGVITRYTAKPLQTMIMEHSL